MAYEYNLTTESRYYKFKTKEEREVFKQKLEELGIKFHEFQFMNVLDLTNRYKGESTNEKNL